MKHPSDRLNNINDFVHSDNSMIHKAKRYDEDVKFLLGLVYDERRRHSACEEEMLVYANPAEVSKVMRLELLDNIVNSISEDWGNKNPFVEYTELENFKNYIDTLKESNCPDKKVLSKIYTLFLEHYNRPSAC